MALLTVWYGGLVLGGAAAILNATPWGIGVRHDSLSYLTAAQNLARGDCLCWMGSGEQLKPLVHFGPAYPALVSMVSMVGVNVQESARWLASLLYGANLAAWGGAVHLVTRRFWAGAALSGLLAASPVLLEVHDAAMSEPLFLLILVVWFISLTAFLLRGRRPTLVLAAAATALAVLTRYAAIPLLLLGAAAILLLREVPFRRRLREAVGLGLMAALLVGIWLTRNYLLAGTLTNRTLRWHPVTIDDAREFLGVFTAWFTPVRYSHWLEGAVFLLILLGLGFFLWKSRAKATEPSAALLGLLLVGWVGLYPLHIAASMSFFDDSVPIDNRMLSPVNIAIVTLVMTVGSILSRRRRGVWLLAALAVLLLIGPFPYMTRAHRRKFVAMQTEGVGFSSRLWRQSESMAWIEALPESDLVYSNRALMIEFLLDRPAYQIPEGFDYVKAEARQDFEEELARMRADLERPNSYLVVFDPARPMSPSDLPDVFEGGLVLLRTLADGFVLKDPSWEATW